jgi:adenylate cyclase
VLSKDEDPIFDDLLLRVPHHCGKVMSPPAKKLVLIVDDTPTNVAVVSGVLKDSFRTKVATNGEKALAIAAAPEKPDLILLDVMMPGMDGYEVCRRLKDIPATRDIPIIFLTAKTEEIEEEKGFDVGAVDYIHKPFSGPIVLARVRTQLALQAALIEAQDARKQADLLLHVLLPKVAADEIKSIGTVIPRRYENVAVLFCDVSNFTSYCDRHEPEDVVSRLDALFVIFERITAKHGLEKIKTIGDGFMAVGGLLHKVEDPVGSAVRCGLEMTSTLVDAHLGWEVRVGVHAGPVVAGVVGQERYQFDIWGDTVNVAARLVGMSAPGSVAVTRGIWETISTAFNGQSLGMLAIKGKGNVSIFGLRTRKP